MIYRKSAALAMALLMVFVSSAMVVRAEEEPALPMPFTPSDANTKYAVYFADNMAFTPQWRIGNLLRIELMVLKTDGQLVQQTNVDGELVYVLNRPLPAEVNADMTTGVVYDQADLMANPSLILNTWMVSVPKVTVTVDILDLSTGAILKTVSFSADFTDADDEELGREINKAGHLIYGMLWDTTGMPAGIPRVTVDIPDVTVQVSETEFVVCNYGVAYAVRSFVTAEDADPIGYELLPVDTGAVGTGGVVSGDAYLHVGVLIAKGGSSGGGGGNGPKGRQ